MVEKVIKYGLPIMGAIMGVDLARASYCPGDPMVLTIGKEAAGGLIFGAAGVAAADAINIMIQERKGGEA